MHYHSVARLPCATFSGMGRRRLNTVTVKFMDMGAAAPLGAIRAEEGDHMVIVVHSGLNARDAFEALVPLLENPPLFPFFVQVREASLRDSA